MKLQEVASRIDTHLKRFAASPATNKTKDGRTKFWGAGAYASGRYCMVTYISYQSTRSLTKAKAIEYLARLDAGEVVKN